MLLATSQPCTCSSTVLYTSAESLQVNQSQMSSESISWDWSEAMLSTRTTCAGLSYIDSMCCRKDSHLDKCSFVMFYPGSQACLHTFTITMFKCPTLLSFIIVQILAEWSRGHHHIARRSYLPHMSADSHGILMHRQDWVLHNKIAQSMTASQIYWSYEENLHPHVHHNYPWIHTINPGPSSAITWTAWCPLTSHRDGICLLQSNAGSDHGLETASHTTILNTFARCLFHLRLGGWVWILSVEALLFCLGGCGACQCCDLGSSSTFRQLNCQPQNDRFRGILLLSMLQKNFWISWLYRSLPVLYDTSNSKSWSGVKRMQCNACQIYNEDMSFLFAKSSELCSIYREFEVCWTAKELKRLDRPSLEANLGFAIPTHYYEEWGLVQRMPVQRRP